MPHGPSFRFVEAIDERVAGERILGRITFQAGPPLASTWPWVPEGLLVEALTQAAGLVLAPDPSEVDGAPGPHGGFLAAVGGLEFLRQVVPGEAVTLRASLDLKLGPAARFDVEAWVGEALAARGKVTLGGLH